MNENIYFDKDKNYVNSDIEYFSIFEKLNKDVRKIVGYGKNVCYENVKGVVGNNKDNIIFDDDIKDIENNNGVEENESLRGSARVHESL